MTVYTIVSTSAVQGQEEAEVNSLTDAFANESEVIGYSRRMAEEMVDMADQLQLDFDYSSVAVYEGDLIEEELTPEHAAFVGLWVLDAEGPEYVSAAEYAAEDADEGEDV